MTHKLEKKTLVPDFRAQADAGRTPAFGVTSNQELSKETKNRVRVRVRARDTPDGGADDEVRRRARAGWIQLGGRRELEQAGPEHLG